MNKKMTVLFAGLLLSAGSVQAQQWNNFGMPGGMPSNMPWGGAPAPTYYNPPVQQAPQSQMPFGMNNMGNMNGMQMPWGSTPAPTPPPQRQSSMPFGMNNMGNMNGMQMPWGSTPAPTPPPQRQSQMPFGMNNMGNMNGMQMPWGGAPTPPPQPQSQMPFGMGNMGNMSNMNGMQPPWGSMPSAPQTNSQGMMMPGMDQAMRSMMQPGKIMAEEATPGMYMKPTWR